MGLANQPGRIRADLTLASVALVYGLSFVAQRTSASVVGPFPFNAVRWLIACLVMLPFLRGWRSLRLGTFAWMGAGGGLVFLGSGLQQAGLSFTTAGNAGFITGLYVILIPLLLSLFWRRHSSATIWLASGLAAAGTFLLGGAGLARVNRGDVLELAGALAWALHVILTAQAVRKLPVVQFAAGQYLVCALLNAAMGLAFDPRGFQALPQVWGQLLFLGVVTSALGFTLQAAGQRVAPPQDAAIILSLETIIAAVSGWLLLGERMSVLQGAGAGLIFLAILLPQLPGLASHREQASGAA